MSQPLHLLALPPDIHSPSRPRPKSSKIKFHLGRGAGYSSPRVTISPLAPTAPRVWSTGLCSFSSPGPAVPSRFPLHLRTQVTAPQGRAKPLSVFYLSPSYIPSSTRQQMNSWSAVSLLQMRTQPRSQYRDENRGPQRGSDSPKVTH